MLYKNLNINLIFKMANEKKWRIDQITCVVMFEMCIDLNLQICALAKTVVHVYHTTEKRVRAYQTTLAPSAKHVSI